MTARLSLLSSQQSFVFAIAVKVCKMRKYFRVHFRILYLLTFALSHFRTFAFYTSPRCDVNKTTKVKDLILVVLDLTRTVKFGLKTKITSDNSYLVD